MKLKSFLIVIFGISSLPFVANAYSNIQSSEVRCDRYRDVCTTDISWNSNERDVLVTVRVPDGELSERREKLFACGRQGREYVNWIRPSNRYVFTMYEGRCPRDVYPRRLGRYLDSVEVSAHNPQTGLSRLDARIAGRDRFGNYRAHLTWLARSFRQGTGVVTVQENTRGRNGRESLIGCSSRGSASLDWIRPDSHYVFHLYEGKDCPRNRYPNPRELGRETRQLSIINGRVHSR